jgi:hypothetical protein
MKDNEKPSDQRLDLRRKMLCLIRSKACKRCGGDLSVECDVYGVYIECIQCGATWNKNDIKLAAAPGTDTLKVAEVKPRPDTITVK